MKLLYINDELATGDGSNYHALGMLKSFEKILGEENVCSFPKAQDGSGKPVNHAAGGLRHRFKGTLQFIRFFRKKYLSIKRSKQIIKELNIENFKPTYIVARSTVFDITAMYVARAFGAKLVYEFNTPEFYERGVIKEEPLVGAIERWEKKVINASDWIYINSNICRDMLCDHYGIDRDKFLVIPNGYMSELYFENKEEQLKVRNEIREKENIKNKFVITFVGSLKVWHGIQSFCEIAENMEKTKNVVFLVLGDGEMHEMIANYVSNHDNMIFKGKVNLETMKRYLYASDLGIMPYAMQECFYYSPLKMFDMIGAELPFIGTAVGQIKEFCENELNDKFLVHDPSIDTYVSKINESIQYISEMRREIENIKDKHSWKNRANILIDSIR